MPDDKKPDRNTLTGDALIQAEREEREAAQKATRDAIEEQRKITEKERSK